MRTMLGLRYAIGRACQPLGRSAVLLFDVRGTPSGEVFSEDEGDIARRNGQTILRGWRAGIEVAILDVTLHCDEEAFHDALAQAARLRGKKAS